MRRGQQRHGRAVVGRVRRRARVPATVLVVLVGAALACTYDEDTAPDTSVTTQLNLAVELPGGTAPATMALPPDYERPDTRGVELAPAMGKFAPDGGPAPDVAMTGGRAQVYGRLEGPDGPVVGATVRLERFVDGRVGRLEVTSGDDGLYFAKGLPGGRYRVRAWLRPSLTVTRPVVVFLGADAEQGVGLTLERRSNWAMSGSAGARGWQVGQTVGVAVLVTQEYVDGEGIARSGGVGGSTVDLAASGAVDVVGESRITTGGDGYARFSVQCTGVGQHGLMASTNGYSRPIPLPYCAPPPPPPTTPPPSVEGVTFTPPAAGPFPAGTYNAVGENTAVRCAVRYEVQAGADWRSATAGPVIIAGGPIRNVQTALGQGPCPYRKTA